MVTGYLHVSGTSLLDSSNNPVKLSGMLTGNFFPFVVNQVNYNYSPPLFNNAMFAQIANNDGNVLRINQLTWGDLEPTNGGWNTALFNYLDQLVAWATANKIYIILSTSEFVYNSGSSVPSWITDISGVSSNLSTFEIDFFDMTQTAYNPVRAAYAVFVSYIANRYANNPFVIFELFNEPYQMGENTIANSNQANLSWLEGQVTNFAQTCGYLISQILANTSYANPIIIGHNACVADYNLYGSGFSYPHIAYSGVTYNNVIWDFHGYMANAYPGGSGFVSGGSFASWQSELTGVAAKIASGMGNPVLVGEWGYTEDDWETECSASDGCDSGFETYITNMINQLKATSGVVGYVWYGNVFLYGSPYTDPPLPSSYINYSLAETTWLLANVMAGGTGPVVISSVPTGYLHRSGTSILDSNGNNVKLVGAFEGIFSELNSYWASTGSVFQGDIANIALAKGNVFRINQIDWSKLEQSQGNFSASGASTYWGYLDAVADWAKTNGIYVIFATAELCNSNGQASIPTWANAASDTPSNYEVNFYNQGDTSYNNQRSWYASFIAYIAQRYSSNPFVLLEIFNEPYFGNTNWYNISNAATESAHYAATMATLVDAAVTSTGYLNPVIIPTPATAYGYPSYTPEYVDIARSNIIYDGHAYWLLGGTNGQTYAHFQAMVNQYISYYQTSFGKPVIIGEWGYVNSDGYTLNDTFDTWTNIKSNLTTMMSFLNSSTVNGCCWYTWGCISSSFSGGGGSNGFNSSESTWLAADVMLGGTGPVMINNGGSISQVQAPILIGQTTGSTISGNQTNAPTLGNTLIAVIGTDNYTGNVFSTVSSITQQGVTWTKQKANQYQADVYWNVEVWLGVVTGPTVSSGITVTLSAAAVGGAEAYVGEYLGSFTLGATGSVTGNSATPSTGSASSSVANSLIIGAIVSEYNAQTTPLGGSSGFSLYGGVLYNYMTLSFLQNLGASTGSYSCTTTTAAAENYAGCIIVLVPPVASLPWTDPLNSLTNWTVIDGTWSASYGVLSGSNSPEALIVAGNSAWTNYQVAVQTIINVGAATNESSVVIRFTDSNDFYWMGLGCYGYAYAICKMAAGTGTLLAGSGSSSSLVQGQTYTLLAVANGSTFSLYVDGSLVLQVSDSAFSQGKLGVRTFNSSIQVLSITATSIVMPAVTVGASVNGSTNPVAGTYPEATGAYFTITATPNSGFAFGGFVLNGTLLQAKYNPLTLTITQSQTIATTFTALPNETLTVVAGANGSISPAAGTYTYIQGTSVTLTAAPNTGMYLDHWIINSGSGNVNVPANGNVLNWKLNSNTTITPVFLSIPVSPGNWAVNYWDGNAWTPVANAQIDSQGNMEELDGQEQAVFNVPNTSANQMALGLNSPAASNVPVQIVYRGKQIWMGVCTGAQMTAANLQCIAYNAVFLALKQAPNTVNYTGNLALINMKASDILDLILQAAATGVYAGTCPSTVIPLITFNNANPLDACKALAQALNLDYWGSGTVGNLQFNIGTRDATTYTDADFEYEATTQRGLDRSQQVNTVIVQGTDGNGNSIQGQAGAGGPVQVYVYSSPSSEAVLNSIAAYELSVLNSPSTGNPLSIKTDDVYNWHPGQYVTTDRPDLALVGTFEIMRITKGPVLTTVEVEVAVPRMDVNLQNLTQQVQGVALNQT
jgi:hypothetical protein